MARHTRRGSASCAIYARIAEPPAVPSGPNVDTAALSRDFVAWSLKQPKMLHDEIVAYDDTPDDSFHWSKSPDEPLGKTKPVEIPASLTGD